MRRLPVDVCAYVPWFGKGFCVALRVVNRFVLIVKPCLILAEN
jgi:hypothetical protein